jgi:hypothetical protein
MTSSRREQSRGWTRVVVFEVQAVAEVAAEAEVAKGRGRGWIIAASCRQAISLYGMMEIVQYDTHKDICIHRNTGIALMYTPL